jgi:hypothetical protein
MAAVTSPPTAQAQEFIREAIGLVAPGGRKTTSRQPSSAWGSWARRPSGHSI